MSKKSLKKNEASTTEVAVAQPAVSGLTGIIEQSDLVIPSLKIAQKTGELGELFMPGSLVLNNEYCLYGARSDEPEKRTDAPVWITVTGARKSYYENLPYGSDTMPQTAETLDEVYEKGGSLDWGPNNQRPSWNPQLTCTLLIKGEDEALFPFEYEGDNYTPAQWTIASISAYTAAAKPILTAAAFNLKAGLEFGSWELTTKLKKDTNKSWIVPVLKTGPKNDEAFVKWVRELTR